MAEQHTNDDIIDTLADMNGAIGARFDKMDAILREHGDRFDKIDRQLLDVRADISQVQGQLDRIEQTILADHARRIEALERRIGSTA